MSPLVRKTLLVAVAALIVAVALAYDVRAGFAPPLDRGVLANPIDLLAFRCAGRVAAQGADPYRAEPLRTCERDALRESKSKMVPNLVVPAPLPPYALFAFMPVGALSYHTACLVWLALLVIAFAATCAVVARLSGLPLPAIVIVLLAADLGASAVIGQIVPLVVLAGSLAALFAREGRPRLAALAALGTMIEPHLGVPLCLGLAVTVPRTRMPLGAGAAVLAALTVAEGGFSRALEYATQVLPAQARAEGLEFGAQYGVSAALHEAGVSAGIALAIGTASYLAMTALGIWLGRRLTTATGDAAYAALVPFALVLVGGAYVHIHQMAAALPLALVLFARARGMRLKIVLAVAVLCLAIPWQSLIEYGPVMKTVFPETAHHAKVDVRHLLDGMGGGDRLAEDAWGAWAIARPYDPRTPFEDLLVKLPTWLGLGLLLAGTIAAARSRECAADAALHLVAV